ncbi:MAG: NUDIX hydrolase [Patescibacteria group bacterium]|jgi:ADP-ribose pyrophosphatase
MTQTTTIKKWQKIKEKKVVHGQYRKMIVKTFKLPNGRLADFEIKDEHRTVCVLAVTKNKQVILVKQFRPGPEKTLLELPGGAVDKNETPVQAIKRELLEETGYAGNFKLIQKSYQCAYSSRIKYNFIATDCKKIAEQNLEQNEFAEVIKMTISQFKKHLLTGNLTDTDCGLLGLNFLKLLS